MEKLLGYVSGAIIIFSLGVFIYCEITKKTEDFSHLMAEKKDDFEFVGAILGSKKEIFFKTDRITINLEHPNNRLRFVDVILELEPRKVNFLNALKSQEFAIRDAVIMEGSKMTPEELASVTGKIIWEGRLRKRINSFFNFPVVNKIMFTRIVIE